ncbi:MAG TPA: protein kinase [Gammaproteobacteria bacterium]|nr:protein kinase [Gammaproteobacteria bacterium]
MGEVYRATDTKLGREVAIKTLPAALATDADRLARFEREAKLLASLNHAHIASVYGLDEHEGTRFIAMELVEGQSLEAKLRSGALPVEQALELGLQIASALEAAHGKGVVHRDLKPANIMITPDGVVKILDFGLAKAFSGDPNAASPAHSPALSVAMTQQGLILGTAGYMSPEQASGQVTDQRADIWAFGVVLYEMLTGMPLFSGESVPHILADVLRTEPDWTRLPKNLPPRLKVLLERCLEKKVRDRYHSIADVRIEVEKVLSDPQGITVQPVFQAILPARAVATRVVAAFLIGGLLLGYAGWAIRSAPELPPAPVNRFTHFVPEGQALRNPGRAVVALSPDGRHFVYNTTDGLYLRSMDELEARRIPGTEENLSNPFFSPDGQSVAYFAFAAGGQLKKVALSGGAPVVIAGGATNLSGASWGSDGTILYGQPEGIFQVSANGGNPELVIPAQEGELLYGPELLPDGDSVLFSMTTTDNWDEAQIVVQSLSTKERTELIRGGSDAHYVSTGHLIYALGDGLLGVAFDAATLTVSGPTVSLVQGVVRGNFNQTAAANYGISGDGTLVYRAGSSTAGGLNTLVWVDRDGNEESLGFEPCDCAAPNVSPDGTQVALHVASDASQSNVDIWVWSLAQLRRRRLTLEPGLQILPLWTPDSTRIAYSTLGRTGLFLRNADGTGVPEPLLQSAGIPWAWAGDDELIFTASFGPSGSDIGIVTVGGDSEPRPLLASQFNEDRPSLSPNGLWLAYESDESGQFEIYVRPFPDVEADKWPVSVEGGMEPVWSRDGRTLLFLGPTSLMEVAVSTDAPFVNETPKAVLDLEDYLLIPQTRRLYDISPDGQRFLLLKRTTTANARADINVVTNWIEELKLRIPTE